MPEGIFCVEIRRKLVKCVHFSNIIALFGTFWDFTYNRKLCKYNIVINLLLGGKMMKKFLCSVVPMLFVFLMLSNVAFASEVDEKEVNSINEVEVSIFDESNDDVTINILSNEEAIVRVAELTGKTVEEVKEEHPELIKGLSNGISLMSTTNCHWVETQVTQNVTSSYKPKLAVIAEACSAGGSFVWLNPDKKPFYIGMIQDSQIFSGDIEVEIKANGFNYLINGRFGKDGTLSHSAITGLNTVFTAQYTVNYTSSIFTPWYTGVLWQRVL
jgi:hypothetical protein